MPPRVRTSVLVVFVLVFLYYVFPFSSQDSTHVVDLSNAGQVSGGAADGTHGHGTILHDSGQAPETITKEAPEPVYASSTPPGIPAASLSVDTPKSTQPAANLEVVSQEQFNVENDALGV